jgi:hypothetical protein
LGEPVEAFMQVCGQAVPLLSPIFDRHVQRASLGNPERSAKTSGEDYAGVRQCVKPMPRLSWRRQEDSCHLKD